MNSLINMGIDTKFNKLRTAIKEEHGKLQESQGVNALILIYPPKEEKKYIERLLQEYKDEYIINLSELLIKYVDKYGVEEFKGIYKSYRSTSVFKEDKGSDTYDKDFFHLITNEIKKSKENNQIPIIIRTGILYGTDIRNNDILESDAVTQLKEPLIILYPATVKEETDQNGEVVKQKVSFLDVVKASDYRGILI